MRALLFDCDGVLGETERDGHRIAFNQMWAEFGVPWAWSVAEYGEKLAISGGRERMLSLYQDARFRSAFAPPADQRDWEEMVLGWHKRKSAIYQEMIRDGRIPGRPGIKRLAQEALEAGWLLGVCSTSAIESVRMMLERVVGEATAERFSLVLAGDMVKRKKPDPAIYLAAVERLKVAPRDCLVVEDSRNGLLAAVGAGLRCLVTVSDYTRDEAFDEAALVVSCLGDPGGEHCQVLANRSAARPKGMVTLADLEAILAG